MEKPARNSTLCYIEREGQYLMLHRTKKEQDVNKDKWIGVGGRFEWGESPEDCLLREVWEETGLTLTDYRYRGIVTFVCDAPEETEYMHLFTATCWTGELTECSEGDLEWVEKERIPELPIWPGDLIFLKLLAEEEPFFSLKLKYENNRLAQVVLNGKIISAQRR